MTANGIENNQHQMSFSSFAISNKKQHVSSSSVVTEVNSNSETMLAILYLPKCDLFSAIQHTWANIARRRKIWKKHTSTFDLAHAKYNKKKIIDELTTGIQ